MLNVYIDTSVVGGCFDVEFKEHSNALFEEFKAGMKHMVHSYLVVKELQTAPREVMLKLEEVPAFFKTEEAFTPEAENLAMAYINGGAVSYKCLSDALHIALATISKAEVLVSWNFKHIVNLNRIKLYNYVNLAMGYTPIEIRTPREILKPVDHEKSQKI